MKRSAHFLLCCPAVLFLFSAIAPAEDLNPPGWRGDSYTTLQKWESWNDMSLIQPATDWDSPFGPSEIEIYDSGPGLEYAAYDPLAGCWMWEISNMHEYLPLFSVDTRPNWSDTYVNKKAHIQVTWAIDFQDAAPPYNMADMLFFNDSPSGSIDGIFPVSSVIDSQSLGIDGELEIYHTAFHTPFVCAELIEIETEEGYEYYIHEEPAPWSSRFLLNHAGPILGPEPLTSEATIYIYEVIVDTYCEIPEPTAAALLALGALLIRKRRK